LLKHQYKREGHPTSKEFWWNFSIKVAVAREGKSTIKEFWWCVSIKEKDIPPSRSFVETSV
jgi:hypothetical protein